MAAVEELEARVGGLETRYRALEGALEGLNGPEAGDGANGAAKAQEAALDPFYGSLAAWVEGFFAPTFARRLGGHTHWCSRWWDHAEALLRLEALWRSWEFLRLDPTTGMGVWLRDFLEPQRLVLMSGDGPFAACDADAHQPPPELPVRARETPR